VNGSTIATPPPDRRGWDIIQSGEIVAAEIPWWQDDPYWKGQELTDNQTCQTHSTTMTTLTFLRKEA